MSRFTITSDASDFQFAEYVRLDILKPVDTQLQRKFLPEDVDSGHFDINFVKKTIEYNASLHIGFGWSFESDRIYSDMMNECVESICVPEYPLTGGMISSLSCDWLGFQPISPIDRYLFDSMDIDRLIQLNNDLSKYQIGVVGFISKHTDFKEHSFLRNDFYRFDYMKSIRDNPIALEDAFHYYIDSIKNTTGVESVPRCFVEEALGCHYLRHPEVFFEILEFYMIKGTIYNE